MISNRGGGSGGNSGVLDLQPYIRRRARSACKHNHVEVDDDAASLTCVDCDADLDPWWYIRKLAHDVEVQRAYYDDLHKKADAQIAQHAAWIEEANARIRAYNADIQHLTDVKSKLQNEHINGERLGTVARRHRRRTTT